MWKCIWEQKDIKRNQKMLYFYDFCNVLQESSQRGGQAPQTPPHPKRDFLDLDFVVVRIF